MKIKIYKHSSIKTPIDDDIQKIIPYFTSEFVKQYIDILPIIEIENTNKDYKDDTLFKPNEGIYDTVMFIYEQGAFPLYGMTTSYSPKLRICYISVNPLEDKIGYSWKVMAHELLHSLVFKIMQEKNVFIPNLLDQSLPTPYFKNDDPYAVGGNFSQQLALLKPYLKETPIIEPSDFYKPKNFTLKELVSPAIYAKYGDKAWQFFDERALKNLQFFREKFGTAYVNYNGMQYRGFDANEYRKNGVSQHNMGRAFDITFKNYTIDKVIAWLKIPENVAEIPYPNIWVELGVLQFHFDIRLSDKKGVYFFNE